MTEQKQPEGISYSKLDTFLTCPTKYYNKYIKKNYKPEPPQEALIRGQLAHSIIEAVLKNEDLEVALELCTRAWLEKECRLEYTEDFEESQRNAVIDAPLLVEYGTATGYLLWRCSSKCLSEEAIRNKDRSIPKNPLKYPPKEFLASYREQDLDQKKMILDNAATSLSGAFARMSLADIVAEAFSYVFKFDVPDFVHSIEGVEYKLKDAKIGFLDGKYEWNGLIDTIYKSADGAIVVNDHKSEKNKREPENIKFDLQLNSYVAVLAEATGSMPDFISITHLPSGDIDLQETDAQIAQECMIFMEGVAQQVEDLKVSKPDGDWPRQWPTKYNSPCIRRAWDTKLVSSCCPYLAECHPSFYKQLEDELDHYFQTKPAGSQLDIIDVNF